MAYDVTQLDEIREWLQGGIFSHKNKSNDLFNSVDLGGKMELKEEEEDALGCVPVEDVKALLRKCAYELGIKYDEI